MKIKNENLTKKKKPQLKCQSQPKPKSKSRSKSKCRKFNPLQYLNALIQLTNDTNALKLKKNKLPQKRDLSSALTTATPIIQKTISSSKMRCKSSYSQYRKKSVNTNLDNLKQVLNVNLNNYIITQEQDSSNCIKFTSMSSSNTSKQPTPTKQKPNHNQLFNKNKSKFNIQQPIKKSNQTIDLNYYAIKIQHAWKSYQTYKMVHRHYKMFKKETKCQKIQQNQQSKMQSIPRDYTNQDNLVNDKNTDKDELRIPSAEAYLNSYYDMPIFRGDKDLAQVHDEIFKRTLKIKVKKPQQSDNLMSTKGQDNKRRRVRGQNSQSSQNQLNLTQKLNNIKSYIQKQNRKEIQQSQDIQGLPTIQIRNDQKFHIGRETSIKQRQNTKIQQSQDSSTQKKIISNLAYVFRKQSSNTKCILQTNQRDLDRTLTLKENFNNSCCDRNIQNQKVSRTEQRKQAFEGVSPVDSMIKESTQKYNQMLQLIKTCTKQKQPGKGRQQDSKPSSINNSNNILVQLLSRLQRHKLQLQHNVGREQRQVVCPKPKETNRNVNGSGLPNALKLDYNEGHSGCEGWELGSARGEREGDKNCEATGRGEGIKTDNPQKRGQQPNYLQQGRRNHHSQQSHQANLQLLLRFQACLAQEQHKINQILHKQQDTDQSYIEQNGPSSEQESSQQFYQYVQNTDLNIIASKHQPSQPSSQDLYSLCSSRNQSGSADKLFKQHIRVLTVNKQKSVGSLEKLFVLGRLSKQQCFQKMQQLQDKFGIQAKLIQQNRRGYNRTLNSVKKQALQFQKSLILSAKKSQGKINDQPQGSSKRNSQSHAIRKSFSAQSIVLKCVLKQPLLTTTQINDSSTRPQQIQQEQWKPQAKNNQKELHSQYCVKTDHKQNSITRRIQIRSQNGVISHCPLQVQDREGVMTQSKQGKYNQGLQSSFTSDISPLNQGQASPGRLANQEQCSQGLISRKEYTQSPNRFQQQPSQSLLLQQQQNSQHYIDDIDSNDDKDDNEDSYHSDEKEKSSVLIQVPQREVLSLRSIQRCSQQLEKLVEEQLLHQLLEEIYMNDVILKQFRPFIEEVFQFTKVSDEMVMKFVERQLQQHYPDIGQLMDKTNQKINPTSLQILKLVRDFQFEIQEYELILAEDIFRKARKQIQQEYQQKMVSRKAIPIKPNTQIKNMLIIQKVQERQAQKRLKIQKYLQYQRDLKIMYLKAVFNCLNEFLIEQKSMATHMNCRSTIGTGQLSLSIKQFNLHCNQQDLTKFFTNSYNRLRLILRNKCMLPSFKQYKDIQVFQRQMLKLIKKQLSETQHKWANYMDQVLEIWNQLANQIVSDIYAQASQEIMALYQER